MTDEFDASADPAKWSRPRLTALGSGTSIHGGVNATTAETHCGQSYLPESG